MFVDLPGYRRKQNASVIYSVPAGENDTEKENRHYRTDELPLIH
jgi:hypothetical protein